MLFHSHLANLVKSFFVHGFIPSKLLGTTLVLLVKDKLGDVCSASKYRSIAISSLILKIIDWVILLNYGHLLKTNNFQFGFQPGSNTSLCTWMVYETIDMFLRAGSIVYGCLLDCTKAFDTVQHSKLFSILLEACVPPIVVRILIYIYRNQTAKVQWKGEFSKEIPIKNGVRQGAVISPIFFNFYMDKLFSRLELSRNGCRLEDFFAGCFGYADDLLILCPSRRGLQEMIDIAQNYVKEHNISFSTHQVPSKSKTKGMVFQRKRFLSHLLLFL